ncbi:hypothetical protein BN1723_013823 [Verticillium longisporum]|uniref:Uncharacterized protein n=2 Tax=Verticillium longisporum TaxID=100787 RepID=A0A0G4LWP2_VERLO|nr:hypothetical protein BN1723_013823 [Verticillium longisporum]
MAKRCQKTWSSSTMATGAKQQTKATAAIHWDDCCVPHVGQYNGTLAVYWARNRLISLSKSRSSRNADQLQRGQPLNEVLASTRDLEPIGMGPPALKRIRLCSDLMAELAEISREYVQMMGIEESHSFELEDWENPEVEDSCEQGEDSSQEDDSQEEEDSEEDLEEDSEEALEEDLGGDSEEAWEEDSEEAWEEDSD